MPLPLLPLLTLLVWWLYKLDTEHMAGCEVMPVYLPFRAVSIVIFCLTFCVLLCLIISTSDFLDLPLCSVYLIGLMFVYAFLMTLLTGKAIDWAAAVWDTDPCLRTSADYFIQQLREVFEYPAGGKSVTTQILLTECFP